MPQNDAQLAIARGYFACRRFAVCGVVGAFIGGRADVFHLKTFGFDMCGDGAAHWNVGVVARNDDAGFGGHGYGAFCLAVHVGFWYGLKIERWAIIKCFLPEKLFG